jgi:hypothetical protein
MREAMKRDLMAVLAIALVGVVACEAGSRPLSVPGATGAASDASAPEPFTPYAPPASSAAGSGGTTDPTMVGAGMAGEGAPPPFGGQGGAAGFAGPPPVPPLPVPPPVVTPFCGGMPAKALPYAIASDFTSRLFLNGPWFTELPFADCNQTFVAEVVGDAGTATDPTAVCATDAGAGDDAGASDDAGTPDAAALPDANPDGVGRLPSAGPVDVTSCVAFRYDPDACVAMNGGVPACAGAPCWSGVIFAPSPFGGPGVCIARGATKVAFAARASREGARVKFGAIRPGLFQTEFFLSLSTTWRRYLVSIPAEDYDNEATAPQGGVWNGFSVVAEPQDHMGGTTILVSDVVWSGS